MEKSRKHFALKNISYNLFSRLIMLILSFVSRSVFIWGLGVEYLGINGLFSDILNLLSMADLGFGIAMVYSLYEPLSKGDERRISGLITFYRKAYLIIAIVVSCVGLILIPFLPILINLERDVPCLTVYYVISLANIVASYLCIYKTSILTADQKNYMLVRIATICSIIRTVVQVITIFLFRNYILYLIIGLVFTVANNIYASFVAEKNYPYISKRIELEKYEQNDILKNMFSVFLFKVSNVLLNATDNLLISVIVGTVVVGYYSNYLLIQTQIISIYALFFSSVTASIGNLIATEKTEKRYEIFCVEQSIGCCVAVVIVPCYMVLVNRFIVVWLGKEYLFSFATVVAIAVNMYLSCVLQPLWTFREATGLYSKTKWIMLICAVVNIGLSIIGGKYFGVTGIIAASAISRLSTYVWYEPQILFTEYFDKSVKSYYINIATNFLIVSFVSCACYGITVFIHVENNIINLVINAIVSIVLCSVVALIAYWRSPGIEFVKKEVIKIRNKMKKC